jgi:hypothetical protein
MISNINSKSNSLPKKLLKIIKYLLLGFLVLVAVFMLLAASWTFHWDRYFKSKEERYFYDKLSEISRADISKVMLKDLTNFDWEYVCEISETGEYERGITKEYYEKYVGFEFKGNVVQKYGFSNSVSLLFVSKKNKNSLLIDTYGLALSTNTNDLSLCSKKNNTMAILAKTSREYNHGFYKLNYHLTLKIYDKHQR